MTKDEQFMEKHFFGEELSVHENKHVFETDGFKRPETYLDISPYSPALLEKVKAAFIKAGWEGKGDIGLMYVKPFKPNRAPDDASADALGSFIWHVRQDNNGKSFLGTYPNSLKSVADRSEIIYNDD
jgi:hypothetical protein